MEKQSAEVANARLLIVDDIDDNRAILMRVFQRRGFAVTAAISGEEALQRLFNDPFDIIVLDWMMPDMDGLQVLKHIRTQFTKEQLPVVMITARVAVDDVKEAMAAGANGYVTKPINITRAADCVIGVLTKGYANVVRHGWSSDPSPTFDLMHEQRST